MHIEFHDYNTINQSLPVSDNLNYRQLPSFSETASKKSKSSTEYLKIYNGTDLVAFCNVRISDKAFGLIKIAYVNWGPILYKNNNKLEIYMQCIEALTNHYSKKEKRYLRITIPPNLVKNYTQEQIKNNFKEKGFKLIDNSYYRTIYKKIHANDEDLKLSLNKKWRSELNRSFKSELTVLRGTSTELQIKFSDIFKNLQKQKNITVDHDFDFFREVISKSNKNEFLVHLALHNNQVVAGHLGSYTGDTAVYLLGATTAKGRELRASYYLHWEIMRYCREVGITYYDLGGIDPENNPSVYRFKKRFSGDESIYSFGFEKYPSKATKLIYRLTLLNYSLYKNLRLRLRLKNV